LEGSLATAAAFFFGASFTGAALGLVFSAGLSGKPRASFLARARSSGSRRA
jgi:hypothetical protein